MRNIRFINAGAGSGKTFTLIQTLAEDIKAGKYNAGEVLLTTFTRKAAEEIKLKARTRLLQDGLPDQAFKLDGAYMGTVHSVGYQFLHKYWYLTGLSPNIKEMAEEDVTSYFKSAIANIPSPADMDALNDFNRKFDFQGSGLNAGSDPFKWQGHVKDIIDLAINNKISDLSENSVSYLASVDWYKTIFPEDQRDLDFSEMEIRKKILYITGKISQLPDARNKGRKDTARELENSVRYAISFNDLWKAVDLAADAVNKTTLGDDPAISRFVNEYAGFYISPAFLEEVKAYMKLIFKLAANSLSEFKDFKKNHGLVDFNDMETMFLELLAMKEVRKDVGSSVKVVMVDEFQDSNPVQLAIFLLLSDMVEESIWVGDPKQAIYGFRGTDPVLVNKLFSKIASADVAQNLKARLLKRSWRSRADLVSLVNNLFEQALEPQLSSINIAKSDVLGVDENHTTSELSKWMAQTFKGSDQVELSPRQSVALIPVREDSKEGLSEHALAHWHFRNTAKQGTSADWINYFGGTLKEWLQAGHMIVDKESGIRRPARPGDVAVLCRSNATVMGLAEELRNLGLEVSAETEGLSETVEFRLVRNVFQLLIDPYDSLAISELMLLFPQKGSQKSVSELLNERIDFVRNAPERDKDSSDRWDYLNEWGRDYPVFAKIDKIRESGMHLSVKHLVQKVIADMDLYGHLIAFGDEDQRRANLQNVIHYADLFSDHCLRMNKGESISAFMDYLDSADAFNKQAASNHPNAVNVLTYHKSKGLEWPVVLLFELTADYQTNFYTRHFFKTTINSLPGSSVDAPLERRFIQFAFWPFGPKKSLGEYDFEVKETDFYKETERKVREEELRLLYVGMTRARDYLISTSFNQKKSKWLKLLITDAPELKCDTLTAGTAYLDLFNCGIKVSATVKDFDFSGPAYEPEIQKNRETDTWFEKTGFRPQEDPLYLSPSKIDSGDCKEVNIVKKLDYLIRVNGVIEDGTLGTLVHNALFLMDRKRLPAAVQSLVARSGAEMNVFPEDLLNMVEQVKQYVEGLGPVKIHRELFMVKKQSDGHVLRGEADLVLERETDLILIDYKTYQGGQDQFMDSKNAFFAGKYAGQLSAYCEMAEATLKKPASRKLIFYVMQGVVVELS